MTRSDLKGGDEGLVNDWDPGLAASEACAVSLYRSAYRTRTRQPSQGGTAHHRALSGSLA